MFGLKCVSPKIYGLYMKLFPICEKLTAPAQSCLIFPAITTAEDMGWTWMDKRLGQKKKKKVFGNQTDAF